LRFIQGIGQNATKKKMSWEKGKSARISPKDMNARSVRKKLILLEVTGNKGGKFFMGGGASEILVFL